MSGRKHNIAGQRGVTTLEFTFCAATLFMMLAGIVAGGVLLWTHNTLVDATRRGARYASLQCNPSDTACTNSATAIARIKDIVIYGQTPAGGASPVVPNLAPANVTVTYASDPSGDPPFGVAKGMVSVAITSYQYNFVIPGVSRTVTLPPYRTTLTGECAGYVPADE